MKTLAIIAVVLAVGLVLTEVILKKVLINISDKIVDIIEALNKRYK